jgi:hypothetical protein
MYAMGVKRFRFRYFGSEKRIMSTHSAGKLTFITYGLKYHAPTTTAHAVRSTPRETPQLQSHTKTVPAIDQPAQFLTCHSHVPLDGFDSWPMRRSRKERVKNGMEPINITRSMRGDNARRKGFVDNMDVVRWRIDDVV